MIIVTPIVFEKLCFENVFRPQKYSWSVFEKLRFHDSSADGMPSRRNKLRFPFSTFYRVLRTLPEMSSTCLTPDESK